MSKSDLLDALMDVVKEKTGEGSGKVIHDRIMDVLKDEKIERYPAIHMKTGHKKGISECGCPMAVMFREYRERLATVRTNILSGIDNVITD